MRIGIVLGALFLAACTAMESSEGFVPPSTPVAVPKPASEIEAPQAEAVDEVEDAEEAAEVPEAEAPAGEEAELTDDQLLALAMGLDPAKVAPPEPEPAPAEVVPQMPAAAAALALDAGWGVRLVAVLPNTQPPRAVLGLASGEEVVVEPGSFVEAARVVVLAVGSEGVQVAYVEPNGDRTKVRTEMLSPLNRADRVIVPQ